MTEKHEFKKQDERISQILDYLMQIASGNYDAHLEPSELEDELDGVIFGLTNLKDELEYREKKQNVAEEQVVDYISKLKEIKLNLEIKVRERTDELEKQLKELKHREKELKETKARAEKSEKFANNIIDSSLDMIIAVDNRGLLTEFNPAAVNIFGYKQKDILGKHINILYADKEEGLICNSYDLI